MQFGSGGRSAAKALGLYLGSVVLVASGGNPVASPATGMTPERKRCVSPLPASLAS